MKASLIAASVLFCFAATANAADGGAIDNSGPWTEMQVKKLCHYRTQKNPKGAQQFATCMENNQRRIGKQKNPEMISTLNHADTLLEKKAKEKATTPQ